MQVNVINFDGKAVGKIDLQDSIFGLDARADILHRFHKGNAPLATQLRDHFLDFLYGNDRHFISLPCAGASGRSGRSNGRP